MRLRERRPYLAVLALWLAAPVISFAYSHFLHYTERDGGLVAAPEKFDLGRQPNGAIPYFISENGPAVFAEGDSLTSLVSQIRAAAGIWNGSPNSRLRLSFGGFAPPGIPQSRPGIDIEFQELPPGLLAMAGPTVRAGRVEGTGGDFIPIARSLLVLPKDLSRDKSWTDGFFLTLIHELGHTIGLQHTYTSGAMSTAITRGTTRAKPLTADDDAAVSLLYPLPGYERRVGAVSGLVVSTSGDPVHLASVVAISASGHAVSSLSGPDGRYRIDGIPPGSYYLYVHPMPPAFQSGLGPGDVVLPRDEHDEPIPASGFFETQFYPEARQWTGARVLQIEANKTLEGMDFAVTAKNSLEVFDVTTYSFPGRVAVHPAFLNVNHENAFLVASGIGLMEGTSVAPGLGVSILGGAAHIAPNGVFPYPWAPSYLQANVSFNLGAAEGPKHLVFSRNGDPYVLPAGIHLVRRPPPALAAAETIVSEQGATLLQVTGTNLTAGTRYYFDGVAVPAAEDPVTTEPGSQQVRLVPPEGAPGHRAAVLAVNPDGQNSLFLSSADPPFHTFDTPLTPLVRMSPASLPAGSEAMVEITGEQTSFVQGRTVAGIGSSDVSVRRVWVLGPDRLWANLSVGPNAATLATHLTVTTGFETAYEPYAFQVDPAVPDAVYVEPSPVNPATGYASLYPGGHASVRILPGIGSHEDDAIQLTLGDFPALEVAMAGDRLSFRVPPELSPGPAILRLTVNGVPSPPVAIGIDPPPVRILGLANGNGATLEPSTPVAPGAHLKILIAGLPLSGNLPALQRFAVLLGGQRQQLTAIAAVEDHPGSAQLELVLSSTLPDGDSLPLVVFFDGRPSLSYEVLLDRVSTPAVAPTRR